MISEQTGAFAAPVETMVSTWAAEDRLKSRTCPQSWSSDGIPEGKLVLQKTETLIVRQHFKLCGDGF